MKTNIYLLIEVASYKKRAYLCDIRVPMPNPYPKEGDKQDLGKHEKYNIYYNICMLACNQEIIELEIGMHACAVHIL